MFEPFASPAAADPGPDRSDTGTARQNPLILTPLPKGGWLIAESTNSHAPNIPVGAYPSAAHMMDGLARLLRPRANSKEAHMPNDYSFEIDVLRGQMAYQLAGNTEQFVFVLSDALIDLDVDGAIEQGQLGDTAGENPKAVVTALREIATAIEDGKIT